MKAVWKWSIGSSLAAVGIALGVMGVRLFAATETKPEPAVMYSQTGRDRAFAEGVRQAKRSIYMRTSSISCVPFANELAQAAQRGVGVHLEMPMPIGSGGAKADFQLVEIMAKLGAWIELGSKPSAAYEGAYLLVDDRVFFYSAGAMEYSEPGIPHSYVRGKKGNS